MKFLKITLILLVGIMLLFVFTKPTDAEIKHHYQWEAIKDPLLKKELDFRSGISDKIPSQIMMDGLSIEDKTLYKQIVFSSGHDMQTIGYGICGIIIETGWKSDIGDVEAQIEERQRLRAKDQKRFNDEIEKAIK